jgi:hypothetical protein
MLDDLVIDYIDRWRDPSGDNQEEMGELLARLGPLLLSKRDLLADTVRAACERDPAIRAPLWTVCQENGAPLSPCDDADDDDADAYSLWLALSGLVDREVHEEVADVIAYVDRWRASGSDPKEIDELLARLGELLLGARDLLIDAIRAACERYPSVGADLWAACEEHRGEVAERDRDDDEVVGNDDEDDEDDDENDDEDDDDDEDEDEDDVAVGNVIDLAKYRRARSRYHR